MSLLLIFRRGQSAQGCESFQRDRGPGRKPLVPAPGAPGSCDYPRPNAGLGSSQQNKVNKVDERARYFQLRFMHQSQNRRAGGKGHARTLVSEGPCPPAHLGVLLPETRGRLGFHPVRPRAGRSVSRGPQAGGPRAARLGQRLRRAAFRCGAHAPAPQNAPRRAEPTLLEPEAAAWPVH